MIVDSKHWKTEAAQRRAIKLMNDGLAYIAVSNAHSPILEVRADSKTIALFDLRDCYRKRAPLKGIQKTMRKAVQPKKKRK